MQGHEDPETLVRATPGGSDGVAWRSISTAEVKSAEEASVGLPVFRDKLMGPTDGFNQMPTLPYVPGS